MSRKFFTHPNPPLSKGRSKKFTNNLGLLYLQAQSIRFIIRFTFKTPPQLLTILSRYQKPNIDRKQTSPSPVQKPPTQYKM